MKKNQNTKHDVIVIGLGVMGCASAFNLAARGLSVLGFDQFKIANDRGSSQGRSRIIRSVYAEDPSYVPLVQRSFDLWRTLEQGAKRRLLTMTGGIDIGPADGRLINGAIAACRLHDLEHTILSGPRANSLFPAFSLNKNFTAVHYPDAGILIPEDCVQAFADAAKSHGADLHHKCKVMGIETGGATISVTTEDGKTHTAASLVVTAGPWMSRLLPELSNHLQCERQVVGWFNPDHGERFRHDRLPVFVIEEDRKKSAAEPAIDWYGIPAFGNDRPKFARYGHRREKTLPEKLNHQCNEQDSSVLEGIATYFSGAIGSPLEMKTCMFTNSADHNFLLGFHPDNENIFIASPCSGHGFKFAPVIGEIVADMIETRQTANDIALHDIKRLAL